MGIEGDERNPESTAASLRQQRSDAVSEAELSGAAVFGDYGAFPSVFGGKRYAGISGQSPPPHRISGGLCMLLDVFGFRLSHGLLTWSDREAGTPGSLNSCWSGSSSRRHTAPVE